MKDSFGRDITYLRISVTDLCNLRCKYCMPEEGVTKVHHRDILSIEEIEEIAKVFVRLGVNKIRLTGGEPLLRSGILDIVEKIGRLEGLRDFAMTTNGILLKKYAEELKIRGLKRVNISLDTLDEDKYNNITRIGKLKDVLEGIEVAREVGLTPIKINAVLVGGFNDDEIVDLVKLTEKEYIDIRFIELMPIGEAIKYESKYFISNQIVLKKLPELIPVERKDISSPAVYYKLPNAKGRIGLINPVSCKFCEHCNRVRLTAQGKLKLCLHSKDEIDLKEALRKGQDIEKIIIDAIGQKPESHHLEDGEYVSKKMYQIGG
ncbi:Molybdenum cofactor biosynthesis protein A [[Clostridium] ultunense Esp]|uniref:GTP 3',8-cyclase n=1 Tax=[Clostridium] ultunense Esp TaxID=1288971 RepID=M1ZBT5_9FIRM|nr:GTP 3',8-cyclase MoaA [Schnuerera ultunensis]CCQ95564.1 Molybdenum cofactor biosynthesis protein A [[Clostridium] ultunense Esp]SHD78202.1 Cyclic pyranopterin monophosphate synthase [[Clostridium] ultunense Esp]